MKVRGGNPYTFEKEIVGPSFSNLFAGGNGTEGNPYTISNYRHKLIFGRIIYIN